MQTPDPDPTHRQDILRVLRAALRAVDPVEAVRAHITLTDNLLRIGPQDYRLDEIDRILVVGGGKAGAPMAAALIDILGCRITGGGVNVKYGHTAGAGGWRVRFRRSPAAETEADATPPPALALAPAATGPIKIIEAGHPVPDSAGQVGAAQIAALLQGLTARDLVIVVISGGGSALLPLPVPGITLADYQALNSALLRCGADITEFNTVRKHCSRLQGGQLARLAVPARVAALILSDVVGSPLDAIASGPTVPDQSTFADALAVLQRYGIVDQAPISVRLHLARGAAGAIPDTPKPGDALFEGVVNVIIGDNASAGRAAVAEARRLGWQSALLTTFVQGEAREVGRVVAGLAQGIAAGQSDFAPPACLVLGGETTVTIRGEGLGGRNQELALAAAIALADFKPPAGIEVAVVSLATDGTDGPTAAAGGIATPDTVARGQALGLDARRALVDNDSYHYLAALGDLIFTGPTNTNVNDLMFAFCV
ncbi:MAG: glycerate kinase [Chloroflexi bacterium HGW-Chloroflexi-1]|nr:MAG: glycerate kinase [Chloroflexi bacterium HGW-Chloroflexi-1]